MNNADDYVRNYTIVLEKLMKKNIEAYLMYNYADIPFVFFEWIYKKENELCKCSLIPTTASKFNFVDIYYQNKEVNIGNLQREILWIVKKLKLRSFKKIFSGN